MQPIPDLRPGLWLIKWIDHFHLGMGNARSSFVDVFLQKLPFDDPRYLDGMSKKGIADLMSSTSGNGEGQVKLVYKKQMLVGHLPETRVGQVLSSQGKVGYIPAERREIVFTEDTVIRSCAKGDARVPSATYQFGRPMETLHPDEYTVGPRNVAGKSRLLVFEYRGIEYILPKMVIFQAFYALSSKLANAFCNGPWNYTAKEVISFDRFESGLATEIDLLTGDWKIVLALAVDKSHAPQIALLWLDNFARSRADAIYSDAAMQNHSKSPGGGWGWYANADIPYVFDWRPFRMRVHGYSLRQVPLHDAAAPKRFLITAITASSWPLKDQVIAWAHFNDNTTGPEAHLAAAGEQYMPHSKMPVEGDADAVASADSDPNTVESVNVFQDSSFTFLDEVRIKKQEKRSSKIYEPGGIPRQDEPASIVSTGNPGSATEIPAPADIRNHVRDAQKQFEFLIKALDELSAEGKLRYRVAGPASDSRFLVIRNGYSCWSLLKRADRDAGKVPRKGWEVIKSAGDRSEGVPDRKKGSRRQRYPRAVMLCEIEIQSKSLVLIDVEPRTDSEGFCMFACRPTLAVSVESVEPVLDAIREYEGRFKPAELRKAFSSITESSVVTIDHRYDYEKEQHNGVNIPKALNRLSLFRKLERLVANSLQPVET